MSLPVYLYRYCDYIQIVPGRKPDENWPKHLRNNSCPSRARRVISLLKVSTIESAMATVNFSVPDEVKAAFDKAFGDQNKSSIIAELMRRAVRERELKIRRKRLFRQLSSARAGRPPVTSEEIRSTRATERS
jgi:hypothetical protein